MDHKSAMNALLEPRPADELFDYEYNVMMRKARRSAWRKAHITVLYLQKKIDAQRYEAFHIRHARGRRREEAEALFSNSNRLVDEMWLAIADLIMTPAPNSQAVATKARLAKARSVPISTEEVRNAITRDERFLAAHPLSRVSFAGRLSQELDGRFSPA